MASQLWVVMVNLIMIIMITLSLMIKTSTAQIAPAMFVFGDSLVDVGNNNYLHVSIVKANFPHNGIDFPTHKATGRFSNGKNAADFLAEELRLPSAPPYLSLSHNKSANFLSGVSFASGGAGIFDGSGQLYHQSLTMNKQIEYLTTVQKMMVQQLGQEGTDKLLSKSIIAIVIGSNDILGYFGSSPSKQMKKGTPQQYVDSMVLSIKDQLKRIYDLGGRKFAMIGVGPVGCCPSQRDKNKTEDCNEEANFGASKYNQGLLSVLKQYQTQLNDFHYTFFDTYHVLLNFIQHPADYGFKEVKGACCGLGKLNAKVACLPFSSYCPNRNDHLFWDSFHPSEAAARILIQTAFSGPPQYAFPVNVRELVSV